MSQGIKQTALRFLLVGIVAFAIDYLLTLMLHYGFGVVGYVASAISFTIGFLFSFSLSRKWVFKPKSTYKYKTQMQITMYLILAAVNLCISSVLIALLSSVQVDVYISKAAVVALVAIWNFIIGRTVIFTESKG